jgi:putative restriction endonuclease
LDSHTAVDAAHIIPWSVSHDDGIRNGMALCKLCHWTFDKGLIGVSASYTVLLSPELTAGYNLLGHLITLKGGKPCEQLYSCKLAEGRRNVGLELRKVS